VNLLADAPSIGLKRSQCQTHAQPLRTIRRGGTEFSQADRIAAEAGDDLPVGARFERDVAHEPGG
jgi:hypothetical protein